VFFGHDFLHEAWISAIREHLRQKWTYLGLHGFSGPFLAENGGFLGGAK